MHIFVAFMIIIGLISGIHPIKEKPKSEINVAIGEESPLVRSRVLVKPYSAIQHKNVVKQAYDYSCGSAALATLLNYQLGENFTEKQVIHGLLKYGNTEKIAQTRQFSMLDMKKFMSALGYESGGFNADIQDLRDLDRPGILPIKIFDYKHFVVFKGIFKDHVFLADPWRGNISFTIPQFMERWAKLDDDKYPIFLVLDEEFKFNGLRLTEEDLRFIDEDTALNILFDYQKRPDIPAERHLNELPGKNDYLYKR